MGRTEYEMARGYIVEEVRVTQEDVTFKLPRVLAE